ncbi:MAG TPA: hypothetical protein VKB78_00490, partial [Pirellulales bacterium]|nr:hypothetical protein [Pirellulales bacterium]
HLMVSESSGIREGLYAERLFLRNLPANGRFRAFAMHALSVAGALVASIPRGRTLTQFAGRLAAWFSLSDYRLHHRLLAVARETVEDELADRAVIARLPLESSAAGAEPERRKRAG